MHVWLAISTFLIHINGGIKIEFLCKLPWFINKILFCHVIKKFRKNSIISILLNSLSDQVFFSLNERSVRANFIWIYWDHASEALPLLKQIQPYTVYWRINFSRHLKYICVIKSYITLNCIKKDFSERLSLNSHGSSYFSQHTIYHFMPVRLPQPFTLMY